MAEYDRRMASKPPFTMLLAETPIISALSKPLWLGSFGVLSGVSITFDDIWNLDIDLCTNQDQGNITLRNFNDHMCWTFTLSSEPSQIKVTNTFDNTKTLSLEDFTTRVTYLICWMVDNIVLWLAVSMKSIFMFCFENKLINAFNRRTPKSHIIANTFCPYLHYTR